MLQKLLDALLQRTGVARHDVALALTPNLSDKEQNEFQQHFGFSSHQVSLGQANCHGHLQGTDFVVNYLSMLENHKPESGKYVVAASHGMGFMAGVALLRM
jgi:3-oxoacyl-[acyl-carrier-protein] synthase III